MKSPALLGPRTKALALLLLLQLLYRNGASAVHTMEPGQAAWLLVLLTLP